jgi:limonene-1,2-epoxide hydrolase
LRLRIALGLALLVVCAACSGGAPSAESVVRAWSHALNNGDNEAAARLFATGAEVVQGATVLTLETHRQAVAWNASLPCSGRIVSIRSRGETATATFVLSDRKTSECDGPGARVTALFKVHGGKIVLWHQTTGAGPPPPPPAV